MSKTRVIVKTRKVGICTVITLPRVILKEFPVKPGDRIMLETTGAGNVVLSKESGNFKNGAKK